MELNKETPTWRLAVDLIFFLIGVYCFFKGVFMGATDPQAAYWMLMGIGLGYGGRRS